MLCGYLNFIFKESLVLVFFHISENNLKKKIRIKELLVSNFSKSLKNRQFSGQLFVVSIFSKSLKN